MDFEEKLIEEVREQPMLFNLGLNDYKNLRKKDSAWKEVGSAMKCDGSYNLLTYNHLFSIIITFNCRSSMQEALERTT